MGLVVLPQITVEVYSGNNQSPFVILGGAFFILGSLMGLRGK